MSNKTKIIISSILIAVSLICGIFMLYFGIGGTAKLDEVSKTYEKTEGYLLDYTLYSKGEYDSVKNETTSDTYILIYNYNVNGREYKVSTDYGTSFIPEIGSTREIRYDPSNPEKAVVVGPNSNTGLIFGGILFIGVPLFILFGMLASMGYFRKVSDNIIGTAIGLFFAAAGYGALYMITGEYSIKGIFGFYVSSFTLPLLIPILLIAAGVFLVIKSLFFSKNTNTEK